MSVLTKSKVLVLNRGWNPIAIVTLKRALGLIIGSYNDGEPKARIMDPTSDFRLFTWQDWASLIPDDDEKAIHSGTRAFKVPEIILVSRYNKLPTQRVHFSRRTIYRRDENTCQYCGKKPGTSELSVDHILPKAAGGLTSWTNCVLACTECNRHKADIVPIRDGDYYTVFFRNGGKSWQVKIKEPKKPRYTLWKSDYKCDSWASILGESYWNSELENDM